MSVTSDPRWTPCAINVDSRAIYGHSFERIATMYRYSPSEGPGYYIVKIGDVTSPRLKTVTACLKWAEEAVIK